MIINNNNNSEYLYTSAPDRSAILNSLFIYSTNNYLILPFNSNNIYTNYQNNNNNYNNTITHKYLTQNYYSINTLLLRSIL